MSEISDKSLIERLLNPSTREEAFRILVEQEGPRLYNRVRRIVQFHDDADDVMQNTFLKAWMALDREQSQHVAPPNRHQRMHDHSWKTPPHAKP